MSDLMHTPGKTYASADSNYDEPQGFLDSVSVGPLSYNYTPAISEKKQTNATTEFDEQVHSKSDLSAMLSMLSAEYARDPGFLNCLCDTIRQHCALRDSTTLKDYLFVSTPSKTLGADDDIPRFRLRNAEERGIALMALNRRD